MSYKDRQKVKVTPMMARKFLKRSLLPASASPEKVDYLCNQINAGLWNESDHTPVVFDAVGNLTDGLQRMYAVLCCQQPVNMDFVGCHGVTNEVQAQKSDAMKSRVVEVNEDLAREWLEKNTFNRGVSKRTVNKYANDMASGNWTLNHQGIAFDDDGVIVDGQHRLMAIVASGVTVPMMVTWGASRVGIDELRARTTAEVVKFGGLSDWLDNRCVLVARQMMLYYCNGSIARAISTSETVSFSEKNKEAIIFAKENLKPGRKGISSAVVLAAFAAAYYHYNEDVLKEMIASLFSGVVVSEEKSAAVRLKFLLVGPEMVGGSSARIAVARKITRAIECYAKNIPIKSLRSQQALSFTVPEERR